VLDDATRRLLRFSLFLQGFAALMMGAAFVIRAAVIGWDAVTFLLGGALLAILGAVTYTIRRLRVR
jgi:hypothetical protein